MVAKITRVPLRDVWAHEALDFTPWLRDNLDVLNDVFPFGLIEGECEKASGTSWADIVAKDAAGGVVVIENQLGTSDHDHLGKVITHVAAHGAKRSIWIVRDARPEHIKAIERWNELGQVEFFLIKVEAVKIGKSEPAAVFTLITGPSEALRTAADTRRRQVSRKSRSLRDIIDECKYFDKLDSRERKECSRMLEASVNLLWRRTGAENRALDGHQTQSDSMRFLDPRLLRCVRHLFDLNQEPAISLLRLSAGQSSALLYMMGSSSGDGDIYRNAEPPSEKTLDWRHWDKARQFWVDLAGGKLPGISALDGPLKLPYGKDFLVDDRALENLCVIAKAWRFYVAGKKPTAKQIKLKYVLDDKKRPVLDEWPSFGGIDVGPSRGAEVSATALGRGPLRKRSQPGTFPSICG